MDRSVYQPQWTIENVAIIHVCVCVCVCRVCVLGLSWHGSVALSDTQFLIHGGYNGHTALNDAFIFDIGQRSPPCGLRRSSG